MGSLNGKSMVVVGGSRGVGRNIVEAGAGEGAKVLAVARGEEGLRQAARDIPGIETLALDGTDEAAVATLFERVQPDILVVGGGAFPPAAPLQEQSWEDFAVNWEADVKLAFTTCKAVLKRPLPAGTLIVLLSSGAALGGSPISGGYAGAKRTQIFIASYCQKESDRLGLGLRFVTLAPRIMTDTALGRYAVAGYSRYLGISEAEFVGSMAASPTAADVAAAVVRLASNPEGTPENLFLVSGKGLEPVAA